MRCSVTSGDLASSVDFSRSSVALVDTGDEAEVGESAPEVWEAVEEDCRFPRSERDRGCSAWVSGRGVFSGASSKLSCMLN